MESDWSNTCNQLGYVFELPSDIKNEIKDCGLDPDAVEKICHQALEVSCDAEKSLNSRKEAFLMGELHKKATDMIRDIESLNQQSDSSSSITRRILVELETFTRHISVFAGSSPSGKNLNKGTRFLLYRLFLLYKKPGRSWNFGKNEEQDKLTKLLNILRPELRKKMYIPPHAGEYIKEFKKHQ